jgi:type IV pilus assembly protein PilQ
MLKPMLRALVLVALLAAPARADRDLCPAGGQHHGAPIDLDVKDADIHDVLRLLTEVGKVNLVVSDEVAGKVTMRIKHVAWDAATCTLATSHKLSMVMQDNILLVRKR